MIELITISNVGQSWYLNKVIINPQHVATITESVEHANLLEEGRLGLGLSNQVVFSKVNMVASSGFTELIVIGSPATIMEKMGRNTKQLLKG